jgi:hypothetical protein
MVEYFRGPDFNHSNAKKLINKERQIVTISGWHDHTYRKHQILCQKVSKLSKVAGHKNQH